jgi:hypothetical protein
MQQNAPRFGENHAASPGLTVILLKIGIIPPCWVGIIGPALAERFDSHPASQAEIHCLLQTVTTTFESVKMEFNILGQACQTCFNSFLRHSG